MKIIDGLPISNYRKKRFNKIRYGKHDEYLVNYNTSGLSYIIELDDNELIWILYIMNHDNRDLIYADYNSKFILAFFNALKDYFYI